MILKSLLAGSFLCFTVNSIASTYQGTVVNVYANGGKVFIIVDNGAFGDASACTSGGRAIYSIDPSAAYGKAMMAISLAAKTTGRLVWAAGDGACNDVTGINAEALSQIDLKG